MMKKKQLGLAGTALLALPFLLVGGGCGEGGGEGAEPGESRTRFEPEGVRSAPGAGMDGPEAVEGEDPPPPPPSGG